MKTKLYLIILLLSFFNAHFVSAQNSYKRLYPEKCDSLIKANSTNPNFVILDVRTDGEWRGEHLEGSINRSTGDSDFQQRLALLPKHKIYLLHCQSGGRSAGAFTKMQNLEFVEVYEMIGGINGWNSNQLPTTTKLEPKLMLVSHNGIDGNSIDTINVTITNRANDQLTFQSISISDEHEITHDFDQGIIIEGAEDYTFSIYHSPGYINEDSTQIALESNGGILNLKVIVEKETTTSIASLANNEIEIYPNPARGNLFFKGLNTNLSTEIIIFNLSGQIVFQYNNFLAGSALSIPGVPEGIHIIRVNNGKSAYSKKLLIQR